MHKYEQKMTWTLVRNVLRHFPSRHPAVGDVFRGIEAFSVNSRFATLWAEAARDESWRLDWVPEECRVTGKRRLRWHELADIERRTLGHIRPAASRRRLELVGHTFKLDSISIDLLELICWKEIVPVARDLIRTVEQFVAQPAGILSILSGHAPQAVERRLGPNGPLQNNGLLTLRFSSIYDQLPGPGHELQQVISQPIHNTADVRRALLGTPLSASLDWDDFDHLGTDRQFVADLLRGAIRRRERGVSVLLFGPPGTGKTEFSRTLADHLGMQLFAIGEEDEHGRSPSVQDRLISIRMGQSLMKRASRAVMMIDEAEDLLSRHAGLMSDEGRFVRPTARVYLHRLLENSAAPMIWICNRISDIDPAVLRRFGFVLEMQAPSRTARKKVWVRNLARHGFDNCDALAERCAELPVTPGIAGQAVRASQIAGRGVETIEHVTRRLGRVVAGRPLPLVSRSPVSFRPELIQCDEDIDGLTDRLANLAHRHFSLCVDGPPGTGKSAWVRHLAERMDMEVRLERASDLISMYVGGTEANIARAFARAQSAGEFLVFDEADSFLRDRRGAIRSWEVTGVNEMLTWMESHPMPFACTTNLLEAVDPAAMRRFTFKLKFDYLDAERVDTAFRHFFDCPWPADVARPDLLTPGDFAVVKKRASIESINDPEQLARMLIDECRHKPDRQRQIGFVPTGN